MLAKKIAYNTFAQIGGKLLGFVISSVLLVVIADRLGTDGMGAYVTVLAFVGIFVNLADLGANLVMVRDAAQREHESEKITGEFLGFRFTFSLFIMALAPLVAILIPQYSRLVVIGVALSAASQFVLLVNQLFVSVLQVRLKMDKASFSELVNRVFTLLGAIVIARFIFAPSAFLYGLFVVIILGSIVNALISYYYAQKEWRIRPHFNYQTWKTTMWVILPMGLYSFLSLVHFKADTIILSLVKPERDVGIYGYAYKIGEIIFTFPVMFVGTVFPKMSELLAKDRERFYKLVQAILNVLILGSVPFLLLIFMFSPYLTLILARQAVVDGLLAAVALRILSIAFVFWFIGTLFLHVMIAASAHKRLIRNLLWAVGLNITLNLIFIPLYSFYAAATITCITECVMFVLTILEMRRVVGVKPDFRMIFPTAIGCLVMAAVIGLILRLPVFTVSGYLHLGRIEQTVLILVLGVVAAVVYGATMYLIKGKQLVEMLKGVGV